jgi:hypothetical protein
MLKQFDFYHFSANGPCCAKYLSSSTDSIDILTNRGLTVFSLEEETTEQLRSIQNELNKQGASDLVVELFISESSINILEESIRLAIALLEGGNTEVQVRRIDRSSSRQCLVSRSEAFSVICTDAKRRPNGSFKFSTTRCSSRRGP